MDFVGKVVQRLETLQKNQKIASSNCTKPAADFWDLAYLQRSGNLWVKIKWVSQASPSTLAQS